MVVALVVPGRAGGDTLLRSAIASVMPPAITTTAKVPVTIAVPLPPREISRSSASRNCEALAMLARRASRVPSATRCRVAGIACCKPGQPLPLEEMTMPQTATQSNRKSMGQKQQPPATPSSSELQTEDQVYGLVSVLYHSLQGAETYGKYMKDAERAGDDELVTFFEQCREQNIERSRRAKLLLATRIDEDEDEDEEDDAEQDES